MKIFKTMSIIMKKNSGLNTYLNDDEIYEVKARKMILTATERSYYYDDVLTAKAYKKLKVTGGREYE